MTSITLESRVEVTDLALIIKYFLKEHNYMPRTRSELISLSIASLAQMIEREGTPRMSETEAFSLLNTTYPLTRRLNKTVKDLSLASMREQGLPTEASRLTKAELLEIARQNEILKNSRMPNVSELSEEQKEILREFVKKEDSSIKF